MTTHHYQNARCQMVIIRCVGANSFFLEKVIFPFEKWSFICPPETRVDVWTHGVSGAELIDSMPAEDLKMSATSADSGLAEQPSLWQTLEVGSAESDRPVFHNHS
jgi:hypothetical protein